MVSDARATFPLSELLVQMNERIVELPGRGSLRVIEAPGPRDAPVVVLLHGLAATALLNWGPSLPALAEGFRVLAPDHRGHGRGLPLSGRFRLEQCADDVAALARALDVERFIAVGYSMGGPIAQLTWKRHREQVAGLVLCATAARFANSSQRRRALVLQPLLSFAARAAPDSFWKEQAERMLERVSDPERRARIQEEVEGTQPSALVDAAAALAHFDSRRWLRGADVPAAIVATTEDGHVPLERQLELDEALERASVFRVQADHYACVARADLFVPTLVEACRNVAMASPVVVTR